MAQKIHELIAIEKDVKKGFEDSIGATESRLMATGSFNETIKSYTPLDENDNDKPDTVHTPLQTTVKDVLNDLAKNATKILNISFQKEEANTRAKADLVVLTADGEEKLLGKDIPVTTLVQLEGYLGKVRNVLLNVPVLDPAVEWENNDKSIEGTWKSKTPKKTSRTRKVHKSIQLAPATVQHKEQAQLITEDTIVGHFETSFVSGALSQAERKNKIEAIDSVISGVKMARSRANSTEIKKDLLIGKAIFDFIK